MFREASRFVSDLSGQGKSGLFVGYQNARLRKPFRRGEKVRGVLVNHRGWAHADQLATLQKSISGLKLLKAMMKTAGWNNFRRKNGARLTANEASLPEPGGIENMTQLPDAMFVIDPTRKNRRKEARAWRTGVSVVDTNCDPDCR